MSPEDDLKRIQLACEALGEHFDSVMIFATRHEPAEHQGTLTFRWGSGNWYARYGHVREWLIREEEAMKVGVRKSDDP